MFSNQKAQSTLEFSAVAIFVIIGIILMGSYTIKAINAFFHSMETSVQDSFDEKLLQDQGNYTLPGCECTDQQEKMCGDYTYCDPDETVYRLDCNPPGCKPVYECRDGTTQCCEWRDTVPKTCYQELDGSITVNDPNCAYGHSVQQKFCGTAPDDVAYDEYKCSETTVLECIFECDSAFDPLTANATPCPNTNVDVPRSQAGDAYTLLPTDATAVDCNAKKCQARCNPAYRPSTDGLTCECMLMSFLPKEATDIVPSLNVCGAQNDCSPNNDCNKSKYTLNRAALVDHDVATPGITMTNKGGGYPSRIFAMAFNTRNEILNGSHLAGSLTPAASETSVPYVYFIGVGRIDPWASSPCDNTMIKVMDAYPSQFIELTSGEGIATPPDYSFNIAANPWPYPVGTVFFMLGPKNLNDWNTFSMNELTPIEALDAERGTVQFNITHQDSLNGKTIFAYGANHNPASVVGYYYDPSSGSMINMNNAVQVNMSTSGADTVSLGYETIITYSKPYAVRLIQYRIGLAIVTPTSPETSVEGTHEIFLTYDNSSWVRLGTPQNLSIYHDLIEHHGLWENVRGIKIKVDLTYTLTQTIIDTLLAIGETPPFVSRAGLSNVWVDKYPGIVDYPNCTCPDGLEWALWGSGHCPVGFHEDASVACDDNNGTIIVTAQ